MTPTFRSSFAILLFLLASTSLAQTPPPDGPPYRVDGNVTRPEKISGRPPVYTEEARKARVTGVVSLETIIDEQGNVTSVKVLEGLGMGLDEAAVEAVKAWKFKPATLDGRPVKVYYGLTVNFTMSGGGAPAESISEIFHDLERRYSAALLARDGATVDSLLSDDLIHIGFEGQIAGKSEYMSFFNQGDWRYAKYSTSDLSVKVFPGTGVVTGRVDRIIRVGGKETAGAFAFTHVWARAGDGWRLSSSHVTTVSP